MAIGIDQTVLSEVIEVIMAMTRCPDKQRIAGGIAQIQVSGPLVVRLRREADQLPCARLDETFDHSATGAGKRDGGDLGIDRGSPHN